MLNIFSFFINGLQAIASLLTRHQFAIGSFNVSILDIFIGLIAMGIIISVFWKGARA